MIIAISKGTGGEKMTRFSCYILATIHGFMKIAG